MSAHVLLAAVFTEALAILLLALATNLDNFAVGVGYAARGRRIGWRANLVIALLNAGGTAVSMATGDWLARKVPEGSSDLAGAALFLGLGVWSVVDALRAPPHEAGDPREAGSVHFYSQKDPVVVARPAPPRNVPLSEAVRLGVALTLTNLLSGVGAGLEGLSAAWTIAAMFLMSAAGILAGVAAGRVVRSVVSVRRAGLCAGAMLVALGLWRMVA